MCACFCSCHSLLLFFSSFALYSSLKDQIKNVLNKNTTTLRSGVPSRNSEHLISDRSLNPAFRRSRIIPISYVTQNSCPYDKLIPLIIVERQDTAPNLFHKPSCYAAATSTSKCSLAAVQGIRIEVRYGRAQRTGKSSRTTPYLSFYAAV